MRIDRLILQRKRIDLSADADQADTVWRDDIRRFTRKIDSFDIYNDVIVETISSNMLV